MEGDDQRIVHDVTGGLVAPSRQNAMRKLFKWAGISVGGIVGVFLIINSGFALIGRSRLNARHELAATLAAEFISSASAERGELIAITRGCTDCHDEGMKGKVFLDIGEGLIVAPNLTKGRGGIGDRYAGLQDWERAIRHGVRPDSTVLLPYMPYDFFNRLSDSDVASVSAYLERLPAVDNELPATKLRFPGYARMGAPSNGRESRIAKRNNPPTTPVPGPTAEYGRYIASTACVGCHSENLQGGPHHNPAGKPAPGVHHVGTWSRDDFIRAIRTGVAPGGRELSDWMPWKKFAMLPDEDLIALHEYLKTLKRPSARAS